MALIYLKINLISFLNAYMKRDQGLEFLIHNYKINGCLNVFFIVHLLSYP